MIYEIDKIFKKNSKETITKILTNSNEKWK